jgi:hypothetical protein
MAPLESKRLETLFRLEIEFHRRQRTQTIAIPDAGSLHTSYALQAGYEPLLFSLRSVTASDIEQIRTRLMMVGDTRDILAASESIEQLLGVFRIDA